MEFMDKKTIRCETCDHKLDVTKEKVYVAEVENIIFGTELYNAIDCECCGCQNLLHRRYKKADE